MFKDLKNYVGKFFLGNSTGIGMWNWGSPGNWTKGNLIAQYNNVVYSVISAIAEDAAKVEFRITKNNNPLTTHPFLTLIKNPNPDMSQFQFLELHFTYMKIFGECYWYLAKGSKSAKIKELYFLNPASMQVLINNDDRGTVKGYLLNKKDGGKETFDKDEVIHFKMPNPSNPYYGLGTIEAAKTYIETEKFASDWTRNSLYNSGRPSGIVSIKGTIDPQQFEQLKRQFKQDFSGTKNAGRTFFTKGSDGIEYQKLGMELNELALKELKDMTRDDIMMMFRVSKTMLGISDDVNYSNAQENHAVFVGHIIRPELDRFVDQINTFLMPMLDKSGAILDYEDPEKRSDAAKLAEWTVGHNKWLTTNDIRLDRNLEPIEGGDTIYQSVALVPLAVTPTPTKSKKVVKQVSAHDIFVKLLWDNQGLWEKKFKKFMEEEYDIQKKEILERNQKAYEEWLFDVDASEARIVAGLSPMSIALIREAAKFALDLANDEDTTFLINERILQFVHQRVLKLAESTNDTTIKVIEETIAEGVANGVTVSELRDSILDIYDATDERAELIARTETLAASNEGALEAYRQSPIVIQKEWVASPDACEFCAELDGTVVGIEEDYGSLGDTLEGQDGGIFNIEYDNVETPPLHPNCRCTIEPVAVETNGLKPMLHKYVEADKRTKESKDLVKKIKKIQVALLKDKKEYKDELDDIDKALNE